MRRPAAISTVTSHSAHRPAYLLALMRITVGVGADNGTSRHESGTIVSLIPEEGTMPKTSFDGKTVVITGAGSGIGRAAALVAAGKRSRLLLTDVNTEGLQETV